MLDNELKEQLRSVFAALENKISLVYYESDHADQTQLLEMLNGVASVNNFIETRSNGLKSPVPRFHIEKNQKPNGIAFTGIPGGHEFTSFVLAILNSDLKGKLPDATLSNRIKALNGPIQSIIKDALP